MRNLAAALIVLAGSTAFAQEKTMEDAVKQAQAAVKQDKQERQHRERRSYPSSVGSCMDPGPKREAEDRRLASSEREYANPEGMWIRTAVYKDGEEFDCREFAVEECFNRNERGEKVGFSYDFIRSEKDGKIYWSVQNLQGIRWNTPHRFEAPGSKGPFTFVGEHDDQFKAPCAIAWINGYLYPIEQTKGDRIEVKLIQYTKRPAQK